MPVKVRITPFEKTIKILIDRNLSPELRSQRVAAFAAREIAAADQQNQRVLGAAPPKTVTVDGRQGAPLQSVDPDRGIIIAEWRLIGDVLVWIMATLKQRSPVVAGQYRDSHTLYADGSEVNAASPPLAQEYTFLNPLPYSRKIEIGKTKAGRDFVIQVPNRIYERTAKDAKARFGNIARIRFIYSALADVGSTAIGKWANTASAQALAARRRIRRVKSTEWLTRIPAIVVTLK